MTTGQHQLTDIVVGDEPEAWTAAGFHVVDGAVVIDGVAIHLEGATGPRGIVAVAIDGVSEDIDGMAVRSPEPAEPSPSTHPNGIDGIDHLVVTTSDCDRTTAALESCGIEARRVRTFEVGGSMRRQTFFWLGRVILELVGPDRPRGSGPAQLWGLALTSHDLDHTASFLADRATSPKPAVQPGRRILTVKTDDLDISAALAVMSPHD